MASLLEMQQGFRRAVLAGDAAAIADQIAGDGFAPGARLQVHVNHVFATLTDALATTFPVVRRLVGEAFFATVADRFIRIAPPRDPRLALWGSAFPSYLRRLPACRSLPYLGDVARLEWQARVVRRAPRARPIDRATILAVAPADRPRIMLRLDPSLRHLVSRWPVLAIWQANQAEGEVPTVRLDAGGGAVELRRSGDGVVLAPLARVDAVFRRAIRRGLTVTAATEAAFDVDPLFDLALAIRTLFDGGYVVRLSLRSPPTLAQEN
ncbi:MAG: putative DNA-binding domain-containing protein [Alphaproteobacteria bacterium]